MYTFQELAKAITAILPGAEFGEDNDGQVVIYTNLTETDNGSLTAFEVE